MRRHPRSPPTLHFKLILADGFLDLSRNQRKNALKDYRNCIVDGWTALGFTITSCVSRDEHRFIELEMDYPSVLEPHNSLRPHILVQISAKPPRLPVQQRMLMSFVGQAARATPEVPAIACVDPVETAADKLSAFSWRMLLRNRTHSEDDPTIVRHLHDLAALEPLALRHAGFPDLLRAVMFDDRMRGHGGVAELGPADRLVAMRAKLLDDKLYTEEYARFVSGMAFAGETEVPDFNTAVAAVGRLCDLLTN